MLIGRLELFAVLLMFAAPLSALQRSTVDRKRRRQVPALTPGSR